MALAGTPGADVVGSLGSADRDSRQTRSPPVSRDPGVCGMGVDHDSIRDYRTPKCALEIGAGQQVNALRIAGWIIGSRGAVIVVLGADEGAGVYYFSDYLSFAGGDHYSLRDDIKGENLLAGADRNTAIDTRHSFFVAARADE